MSRPLRIEYVVLNPVRATMVREVGEWPWSSFWAMVGREPAPAWLETDWVLGQFGRERFRAQAGYAAFVRQGIGQPSVWEGLRHQVFLGSQAFVERHCGRAKRPEQLREVPRAQRRPLSKPLTDVAQQYPIRHEAMARAFRTGVYTMRKIADHFSVHCSTVSRAVRRLEAWDDSAAGLPPRPTNA